MFRANSVGRFILLLAIAGSAFGQPQQPPLTFEVATVKPTDPAYDSALVKRETGGVFSSKGIPLDYVIAIAYGVNRSQVLGGPAWLQDRYDIVGKAPEGTSKLAQGRLSMDQARTMLRALFAERFQLRVRQEKKVMPVYALVVGKSGPKLRARSDEAGDPELIIEPGPKLPARNVTIENFAWLLQQGMLDRPVIDKTGLSGRFDFDLAWRPDANADSDLPDLFTAIQEQLGLKIERENAPADVILIQSIERPSEN